MKKEREVVVSSVKNSVEAKRQVHDIPIENSCLRVLSPKRMSRRLSPRKVVSSRLKVTRERVKASHKIRSKW